jgi:hypothetical protein
MGDDSWILADSPAFLAFTLPLYVTLIVFWIDRRLQGPATLSWLGAVAGNAIVPLGVDRFGQSGDIPDLYRAYGIDTEAILDAAARACLTVMRQTEPTLA